MKKIFLCFLVCLIMLSSVIPVFATEVGGLVVKPGDKEYVQDEETGEWVEVPPETEPKEWDEIIEEEDPNEGMTEEDIYDMIYGDKNNNNGSANTDNNGTVGDYTDIDINVGTGEGTLTIIINAPEDFKRDILVELYERSTGEVIKIPVYALNKWEERATIPAGNYMVYNVLAAGDDSKNPEYLFEVGMLFSMRSGGTNLLKINNMFEEEPTDNNQGEVCDPDGMTDTGLKPEDLMTDEEIEKMNEKEPTAMEIIQNLFKGLFSWGNLFLLVILAGSCIAYLVYKKKQNED